MWQHMSDVPLCFVQTKPLSKITIINSNNVWEMLAWHDAKHNIVVNFFIFYYLLFIYRQIFASQAAATAAAAVVATH